MKHDIFPLNDEVFLRNNICLHTASLNFRNGANLIKKRLFRTIEIRLNAISDSSLPSLCWLAWYLFLCKVLIYQHTKIHSSFFFTQMQWKCLFHRSCCAVYDFIDFKNWTHVIWYCFFRKMKWIRYKQHHLCISSDLVGK